jgi:hypothetical protein
MPISDPIRLRYDERPLRGFLIHLGVYVLVVLGLIAFNLVNNPTKLWSLWVLAGWGIGIAAHGGVIWMKAHPGQHHWFASFLGNTRLLGTVAERMRYPSP